MTFHTMPIHPAVRSLGWALLHFLWQGALLAALFSAMDTLIGRSQARLRYAIGCMAMLLMPAVFVATIFRNHPFLAPASPAQDIRVVVASGAAGVHLESAPGPARGNAGTILPGRQTPSLEPAAVLLGLLVCLWLAGIVAFSTYTAGGWIRVRRLRRRGVEPVNAAWIETAAVLLRRLQVSRPVRLYTSAIAEVPLLIGWIRPYLLFPVAAIAGLGESQLRAVLAHELAHVRRHDYLVNLLQTAVETLLFYHPAVWWLSRRVRQEREHSCDDLAVEVCGDAVAYAGALARLEELRGAISEPALAATGGDLLARIQRLTGQSSEKSRDRIPGPLGVTMAVAFLLCAAIGAANAPAIRAQSPAFPAAAIQVAQVPVASVPPPPAQANAPQAPAAIAPKPEAAAPENASAGRLLEFGVASVKPVSPDGMEGVKVRPGGRVEISRSSLKSLIATAFRLSYWQISGGDEWTAKDRYRVVAKPPENLQPGIKDFRYTVFDIEDRRLREMLQALLIDRFQLQFHRATKTGDVYLLQRSGKTLRLRPIRTPSAGAGLQADGELFGSIGYVGGQWSIFATSMPQLAKFASSYIFHAPVVDRTELSGSFDYRQAVADVEPNYGPDQSDTFRSFVSELGLKLERTKGPVETFVIDHAVKPSPD